MYFMQNFFRYFIGWNKSCARMA